MSARHFPQLFTGPPERNKYLDYCAGTFVAFYITFCMADRKGTSRTTRFSNNSYLSPQKRGIETSK